MVYTYNFNKNSIVGTPISISSRETTELYGRVLDVILDESHSEYIERGGSKAINGIFYKPLNLNEFEDKKLNTFFAYQSNSNIVQIPVPGEIVRIETLPGTVSEDPNRKSTSYYTRIINIWNHPNTNTYLNTEKDNQVDITGNEAFVEDDKVSPLKGALGDMIVQGRQGQSLRFTGAKNQANPYIDDSNKGKPLTILRNGQVVPEDGFTAISEDINKDASSLYLASDHEIPLNLASLKRDSYENPPVGTDKYRGAQALLTSDRVVINAKKEALLLSSITSLGLNTEGTLNLDSKEECCIDSPAVYIGRNAKQPILYGNQVESFLETLIKILEDISKDMSKAKTVEGNPIPLLNKRGTQAQILLSTLKSRLNPKGSSPLKSKKIFIE